jgi:hypothetical protein
VPLGGGIGGRKRLRACDDLVWRGLDHNEITAAKNDHQKRKQKGSKPFFHERPPNCIIILF